MTIESLPAKWRGDADAYVAKANERDSSLGCFRWAGWMRDELRAKAGICHRHADELAAALATQPKDGELLALADWMETTCSVSDTPLAVVDAVAAKMRTLASRRVTVDDAMLNRAMDAYAAICVRDGQDADYYPDAMQAALTAALQPDSGEVGNGCPK